MLEYVGPLYSQATTIIAMDGRHSHPIHAKHGVRQGDPMSPMIFNMVLDGLLRVLPELEVRNLSIPYACPEQAFRYLGVDVTAWNNVQCENTMPTIIQAIRNVVKMKLKPHQKMDLILRFLLTHFLHKLIASAPQGIILKELDHEIRQEVKKILDLTPSTTDGKTGSDKTCPKNGGV